MAVCRKGAVTLEGTQLLNSLQKEGVKREVGGERERGREASSVHPSRGEKSGKRYIWIWGGGVVICDWRIEVLYTMCYLLCPQHTQTHAHTHTQ